MNKKVTRDILKAIPIGGHGEIGKNSWLFEYKDEILIVNFGLMLPPHDLAGVDLILPSTDYLIENESKISGLILSSPHDDSCGGVFYLLNKVKIPKIWGSKLAIEQIKNQMPGNIPTEIIESRMEFQAGNSFVIKPMCTNSILPDTYGLFIKTSVGNILYTGSYKIDQTSLDKIPFDHFSFSQAGEEGVDLLLSDSTNIETPGYSQSEKAITKRFNELFKEAESRIIIAAYASSLYKYQIIFNLAQKNNKKVLICGDYLAHKIEVGIKSGFIKADKNLFVEKGEIADIKDKDLVIIVSGKYGNCLPSLIEIAKQEHPLIKLKLKDTVVVSANPPPGTSRVLAHTIDQLFVQKVQVVGGRGQSVHVSGHASQEEAKFMLTITKPRSFVPSHGEERQLVLHEAIAETMGISPNDIHILKNGDVLELREQIARVSGKIPAQSIYYNLAHGLDIDETTMKERQTLSKEGTITVALSLDEDRNIIAGPQILAEACSFAKGKDWRAFCLGTNELVKEVIKQAIEKDEKKLPNLKSLVRDTVNKNVIELVGKRPLINVTIQEIKKAVSHKS